MSKTQLRKRTGTPLNEGEKLVSSINVIRKEVDVQPLINDALQIVNQQMQRLLVKSSAGYGLDQNELQSLKTLTAAIKELSTEKRSINKEEKISETLESLSTDELVKLLSKQET